MEINFPDADRPGVRSPIVEPEGADKIYMIIALLLDFLLLRLEVDEKENKFVLKSVFESSETEGSRKNNHDTSLVPFVPSDRRGNDGSRMAILRIVGGVFVIIFFIIPGTVLLNTVCCYIMMMWRLLVFHFHHNHQSSAFNILLRI